LLNIKGTGSDGEEEELERCTNVEPEIERPTKQEVTDAIKYLKNNKAPGEGAINVEMIKYGGETLHLRLHQLMLDIYQKEERPEDWKMANYIPIHKKGDKMICQNYRGIASLMVTYKLFSRIFARRMTPPYMEEVVGDYQCRF
jgi:hypothetical protein